MKYWLTFGYVQFLIDSKTELENTGLLTPNSLAASHNTFFARNLVLQISPLLLGDLQTQYNFAVGVVTHCFKP
jgi:hypothetical protein